MDHLPISLHPIYFSLGFIVHPLSSIRNLFTSSERNSDPTLDSPAASIDTLSNPRLASRVNFLKIANNEFLILVGFENGRVAAWDIQTCLQSGNVSNQVISIKEQRGRGGDGGTRKSLIFAPSLFRAQGSHSRDLHLIMLNPYLSLYDHSRNLLS